MDQDTACRILAEAGAGTVTLNDEFKEDKEEP